MKFYDDPLYIEMCRKAREIQEARGYDVGDFFDYRTGTIIYGSEFDNNESCRSTNAIWLPRLDQLIDMLTDRKEIGCVYGWGKSATSWSVVMLGVVMELNHSKRWDFEKKEWVRV
jgi:hypothetical protein